MPALKTLAKTLWSWREPIARMWDEGISRREYGFRNFQNYRLRVRPLCG